MFYKIKNYDSHLAVQELGKLNFKANVTSNGLEKYTRFNISNKLVLIDSLVNFYRQFS